MTLARPAASAIVVLVCAAATMPLPAAHRSAAAQPSGAAVRINLPYADAKPVLETLRDDLLPIEFRGRTSADRERVWGEWVSRHDREIRTRLERGDEDSIVNLLLFGVTFTKLPRVTEKDVPPPGESRKLLDSTLVQGRLTDLVEAIAAPGTNERLLFARRVAERNGFDAVTVKGRDGLRRRIADDLRRVLAETNAYAQTGVAGQLPTGAADAVKEATFFKDRGLSSDTSILPDVAIDQALGALKSNGLLRPNAIRRIAIVGPGLDFADKRDGYDFYPQQTLQPFALIDSALRLGLSSAGLPSVTTFDLSGRVNQHLHGAVERARAGQPYLLNVARDTTVRWNPEVVSYWERFGDRIGEPSVASGPAAAGAVVIRSVRVRPEFTRSIDVQDTNIVLQRIEPLPPEQRFDLIVATNVLVYYDVFDQCLALTNIARMLQPGGVLLSNTDVPVLPHLPLARIGYTELVYTDKVNAADRLIWFQRTHE
jgi:SAM-dependent methyltransferase